MDSLPTELSGKPPKEAIIERDTCIPKFRVALFTIARTWKQCKCPSTDEWIRKLWYMYTMDYYSSIKRNAFESVLMRWTNLEFIIQSEVRKRKKTSYIDTYIWNLKRWYWCTYLQGNSGDTDIENRPVDRVMEGEGGKNWKRNIGTDTLSRIKQIASGNFYMTQGAHPNSVLWNNLEGWNRMGSGSIIQEGEDICIPMANSCLFMAETNTIL